MLFREAVLVGIADGRVTCAYRRWTKPTVRAGGTLRTAIGVLAIDAIDEIEEGEITDDEARQAGFSNRTALLKELAVRPEGRCYPALPFTAPATIRVSPCERQRTFVARIAQKSNARSPASTAAQAWPGRAGVAAHRSP